ncbi:unnamed protein product [Rotaria sp. Silwood1]|nr:unnamed protein product [Rotaria sp. Silwood1]CAF1030924.1 unnamed protein product [Rotaria sp. Silwood1]
MNEDQQDDNRPTRQQIIEMRCYMLLYMKQLVISSPDLVVSLMSAHPKTMLPAFDRGQRIRTVFKLLASSKEVICLQALKSLGFFLQRSTNKIILQISVWQEYLLGLAYVYPSNDQQIAVTDRVFELSKILLHHAIKFEFGGWRVGIDTLSILHGRVTKKNYCRKINKMVENMIDNDENDQKTPVSTLIASSLYTPIEGQSVTTLTNYKSTKPIADFINHSNHQIFCANVVHIISPMSEVLCNVCGGLLPLLASAISASHEIEILENTEDLSPFNAIKILEHVISLADLFILANSSNFFELKQ